MRRVSRILTSLLVTVVLTTLVAATLGGNGVSGAAAARNTPDGIRVAGAGWVQAQADLVTIGLGVDIIDDSLDSARNEAAIRMQGVIDYLKAAGIPQSDIRTTGLDVAPQYDSSGQRRGYRVWNQVEVTSRDVAGSSDLIDGAVSAGATRVSGLSFAVEDLTSLKVQARDLALDNARAYAEKFARESGVELGPLLAIEEADASAASTERTNPQPMAAASPAAAAAPANPPTEPGMMQIQTDLQMAWARMLPPSGAASSAPDRQEIDTVGRGVVIMSPDVSTVTLGVSVANASLPVAWEDAKGRMTTLIQALVDAGVPETEIRTTNISLERRTDRDGNSIGYWVRNLVTVRSTDVPGTSALIGQAMNAGATEVVNIGFGLADRSGPMDRARSLALENARTKAEQLARRAGVELGRPIAIGSSDTDGVRPFIIGVSPPASRHGTPILSGVQGVRTTIWTLWAIQ